MLLFVWHFINVNSKFFSNNIRKNNNYRHSKKNYKKYNEKKL